MLFINKNFPSWAGAREWGGDVRMLLMLLLEPLPRRFSFPTWWVMIFTFRWRKMLISTELASHHRQRLFVRWMMQYYSVFVVSPFDVSLSSSSSSTLLRLRSIIVILQVSALLPREYLKCLPAIIPTINHLHTKWRVFKPNSVKTKPRAWTRTGSTRYNSCKRTHRNGLHILKQYVMFA